MVLEVEHSGPGIDPVNAAPDIRGILYDQAWRHGHGTSICRLIIEAHGGKFSADRGCPNQA